MLEERNKRHETHLTNLIGRRSNHTPNFALLIGSGASASSGVKTGGQMIAEWRRQLYQQSQSKDPFQDWLQKQDWYQREEEYAILFEQVCDRRSHRRIYVEECVKDAKPSWGYIYLANIIAQGYFNVVFTPNFDDLANDACFLYADLRPIVCAHDSAVADIRVTSARPKIIKLHGDFLYDSIKNTLRETASLEKNMRDKFMQFSREYGLVVVGYGGNDRSIMDILQTMLRSEGYLPNGLYWCRRKQDKVTRKVDRLMRQENAFWVHIDGFDEFMANLHQGFGLTLPNAVRDPYRATTDRLNSFIVPTAEVTHPVIREDMAKLEQEVKNFEQVVSGKAPTEEFDRLVPYELLGDMERRNKKYEAAVGYYEKALVRDPDSLSIMNKTAMCYNGSGQFDKALKTSEQMITRAPKAYEGYRRRGSSLIRLGKPQEAIASFDAALQYTAPDSSQRTTVLINRSNARLMAGDWQEALRDAEDALQNEADNYTAVINRCIALKNLNREEDAKEIIRDALPQIRHHYNRAGAFAVLGDKENMLAELKAAIDLDPRFTYDARSDPDFEDFRDDPDFRKLVYEEDE